MLSVEDRYYKLNRIFLKALGLWPYWNSKWKYAHMITITIIFVSAIFVQLSVFITHDCTLELTINVLSFVFPSIFMMFMYYLYYFCSDAFKTIMEHMYYDWKSLKSKAELDILDDYASVGRLFTEIFTSLFAICVIMTILPPNLPLILDIVLPLNESRKKTIYVELEYFVDRFKYYELTALHFAIFICLGMFTILSTGTIIYHYALHACGVFKITNYRMEMMINKDVLRIPSSERERVILERLICAVNLHRRNLLFCDFLMLQIKKPFIVVIISGVGSLSICMFRLMQSFITHKNLLDMFIPLALVFSHFCIIFFGNHIGQQMTNNNAEIFDTVWVFAFRTLAEILRLAYKLQWYVVSKNIQKLVLFLLRKGNKNFYLSIGDIYDVSYEGFTTLITSAISYFTVIYAVQ